MRWLLVLMLVNGLAPDLAEAAEAVVHVVVEGHVPHGATDPCEDDRGAEHGCGTGRHLCSCCPSQAMAPHTEAMRLARLDVESARVSPTAASPVAGERARPFRPPIG